MLSNILFSVHEFVAVARSVLTSQLAAQRRYAIDVWIVENNRPNPTSEIWTDGWRNRVLSGI